VLRAYEVAVAELQLTLAVSSEAAAASELEIEDVEGRESVQEEESRGPPAQRVAENEGRQLEKDSDELVRGLACVEGLPDRLRDFGQRKSEGV